jgi:hypothetical protein
MVRESVGMAMPNMKTSITTMNRPRATLKRIIQGLPCSRSDSAVVAGILCLSVIRSNQKRPLSQFMAGKSTEDRRKEFSLVEPILPCHYGFRVKSSFLRRNQEGIQNPESRIQNLEHCRLGRDDNGTGLLGARPYST